MYIICLIVEMLRDTCPQVKKLQENKGSKRCVSLFSYDWRMGNSVNINTIDLSQLILKEWKKKKHAQYVLLNTPFFLL